LTVRESAEYRAFIRRYLNSRATRIGIGELASVARRVRKIRQKPPVAIGALPSTPLPSVAKERAHPASMQDRKMKFGHDRLRGHVASLQNRRATRPRRALLPDLLTFGEVKLTEQKLASLGILLSPYLHKHKDKEQQIVRKAKESVMTDLLTLMEESL